MSLHKVKAIDYSGLSGVLQVRFLQQALEQALLQEDWPKVRRLDRTCVVLIDKVIAANKEDKTILILALSELKDVYAGLIMQCQCEVAAMAY